MIRFFTRNRHETTTAAAPVTDQTKPDNGARAQAASAWTAGSIADSTRSKGRVGFGHNDVHFATGSAVLAGDSQAVLDQTAQALRNNPDWKKRIVGHTNSAGSSGLNDQLAQQRASNVLQYVVSHGITQSRLSINARGHSEALASNATDGDRAENRRVELIKQ